MRHLVASVLVTAALVALVLGGTAETASAIPLEVQGTTSGSFSLNGTDLGSSIALLGLSFTGVSFGPTTSTSLDLGTFSLSSFLGVFNPFDFTLDIEFLVPPGAGATSLHADLAGAVVPMLGGLVRVDFVDNGPIHFAYGNGGSFDLSIADLTIWNGQSRDVAGTISNVVASGPTVIVPVAGTLLLVLAGLGLASTTLTRRRR
jgi:hypothetical protein